VNSKFRESRNKTGCLNYLRADQRLTEIKGLPIFNTRTKKTEDL